MDPLITRGEFEAYLQRPVDPAPADLAIAGASGTIRAHCGWVISRETDVTLYVAGTGSPVLSLPTLMLLDVTEVRVDGDVIDPAAYAWARRGQILRGVPQSPARPLWTAWSRVEVDCTHGYDPIPDAVKLVALSKAALHYSNPETVRVATTGSVSRTYFDVAPLDAAILDAYRIG